MVVKPLKEAMMIVTVMVGVAVVAAVYPGSNDQCF